jgi:hypothetical protein
VTVAQNPVIRVTKTLSRTLQHAARGNLGARTQGGRLAILVAHPSSPTAGGFSLDVHSDDRVVSDNRPALRRQETPHKSATCESRTERMATQIPAPTASPVHRPFDNHVALSRASAGLPKHVEDPLVLARIVQLLTSVPSQASARIPPAPQNSPD